MKRYVIQHFAYNYSHYRSIPCNRYLAVTYASNNKLRFVSTSGIWFFNYVTVLPPGHSPLSGMDKDVFLLQLLTPWRSPS